MSFRLEPDDFLRRFVLAADAAGFRVEQYGEVEKFPLLAAENFSAFRQKPPKLEIYVSAGIHGDEPAGPLALLKLLQSRWFSDEIAWHLLPMLNPRGFAGGTREAPGGIDLNRDYRADRAPETRAHKAWLARALPRCAGALALHEDYEATGFYLYEVRDSVLPEFGNAILRAVEPAMTIEPSAEIDGFPATRGLICPHAGDASDAAVVDWPEQLFLRRAHTDRSLTFETPSASPIAQRVAAQILAIKETVALLLEPVVEDYYEI